MYRQGDVMLVRAVAPKGRQVAVQREAGRVVLAHGEVTGHAHAFAVPGVTMYDVAGVRYVDVAETAPLEEHTTIHVPPGTYRVVREMATLREAVTAQQVEGER